MVLLAAGIGTALCTTFYYLKYHQTGDLEHPYPAMMEGRMMKQMMMKQMMRERAGKGIPPTTDAEHEEH